MHHSSPTVRRRRARAGGAVAIAATIALLATGCATSGSTSSSSSASATASASADRSAGLPSGWTFVEGAAASADTTTTPQLPTTVTDSTGAKVTVKSVKRIISSGDDVSSILGALGLAKNVYAASSTSIAQEGIDAKKHFTFGKETGAEGLLSLNGTLFIGDNIQRHSSVAAQFRKAGTPATVFDANLSIEDKILAVADSVGMHSAGEKLAKQVKSELASAKKQAPKKTVTVIEVTATGAGGNASIGSNGTTGQTVIEAAGGTSVGADAGLTGYSTEMSDEGIVSAAPDVILMSVEDFAKWGKDGLWKAFPSLKQTPAGESDNVIVMPDRQMKFPGPETGTGAIALAKALRSMS